MDERTQVIKIKIKDLPEGYFKERLTDICVSPDVEVHVVAKLGYINDWAAYIGFPQLLGEVKPQHQSDLALYLISGLYEPEDVEARGDKLGEEEACLLFPVLSVLNYRR